MAKDNSKKNSKGFVISRGNLFITTAKSYGSIYSALIFPTKEEAQEYLNINNFYSNPASGGGQHNIEQLNSFT